MRQWPPIIGFSEVRAHINMTEYQDPFDAIGFADLLGASFATDETTGLTNLVFETDSSTASHSDDEPASEASGESIVRRTIERVLVRLPASRVHAPAVIIEGKTFKVPTTAPSNVADELSRCSVLKRRLEKEAAVAAYISNSTLELKAYLTEAVWEQPPRVKGKLLELYELKRYLIWLIATIDSFQRTIVATIGPEGNGLSASESGVNLIQSGGSTIHQLPALRPAVDDYKLFRLNFQQACKLRDLVFHHSASPECRFELAGALEQRAYTSLLMDPEQTLIDYFRYTGVTDNKLILDQDFGTSVITLRSTPLEFSNNYTHIAILVHLPNSVLGLLG